MALIITVAVIVQAFLMPESVPMVLDLLASFCFGLMFHAFVMPWVAMFKFRRVLKTMNASDVNV